MHHTPRVNVAMLPAIETFFTLVEQTTERFGLAQAYEAAIADSHSLLFPVQSIESETHASIEAFNQFLKTLGGLPVKYLNEQDGQMVRTHLIGCYGVNYSEGTWLMVSGNFGEQPSLDSLLSVVKLRSDEFRTSYHRAITEPS